jgi:MFS family permease
MLDLTLPVAALKEFILDELQGHPRAIGWFFAIEMLAYLLAAPVWGTLSDRFGRRRIFLVLGFGGSSLLSGLYLVTETVQQLLVLRFFQGAFSVMGWSTALTVVADSTTPQDRSRVMGFAGAAIIFGVGCGAPLGGWLAYAFGARMPLAAASILFSVLALLSLQVEEPVRGEKQQTVRQIVGTLLAEPHLLLPWGVYAWVRAAVGIVVILLPLYAEARTGASAKERGELLGLFLLPFALLQPLTYRLTDRLGVRAALVSGLVGFAAGLMFLPWWSGLGLALWMVLLGTASAVLFPPTLFLTVHWTPPASRATGIAGFNLCGSLGFGVGPLLAVPLLELFGFRGAFALVGFTGIALAPVAASFLPVAAKAEGKERRAPAT